MFNSRLSTTFRKNRSSTPLNTFSTYSTSLTSLDLLSSSRRSRVRRKQEYKPSCPCLSLYRLPSSSSPFRKTHYFGDSDEEICQEEIVEVTELDHYPTLMERWGPDTKVKVWQENDLKIEEIVEFEEIEPTIGEEILYELIYKDDGLLATRQISRSPSKSRNFRKIRKRRIKRKRQIGDASSFTNDLNFNVISTMSSCNYSCARSLFEYQYSNNCEKPPIFKGITSSMISYRMTNDFLSDQNRSLNTQQDTYPLSISQNKNLRITGDAYTNGINTWITKTPMPFYLPVENQSSVSCDDIRNHTAENEFDYLSYVLHRIEALMTESCSKTQPDEDARIVYESDPTIPVNFDDKDITNIKLNQMLTDLKLAEMTNEVLNKNVPYTIQGQNIYEPGIICNRRVIHEGIKMISDQRTTKINKSPKQAISYDIIPIYNNTNKQDNQRHEEYSNFSKADIYDRYSMFKQNPYRSSKPIGLSPFDTRYVNSGSIAYDGVALNTRSFVFHKSPQSALVTTSNADKSLNQTVAHGLFYANQVHMHDNKSGLETVRNEHQAYVLQKHLNEFDPSTARIHRLDNLDDESVVCKRKAILCDSIPVNGKQQKRPTSIRQCYQARHEMKISQQVTAQKTIGQYNRQLWNETFDNESKDTNSISSFSSMEEKREYDRLRTSTPLIANEEYMNSVQRIDQHQLRSSRRAPSHTKINYSQRQRVQETLSIAVRISQNEDDNHVNIVQQNLPSETCVHESPNTSYLASNNRNAILNNISMRSVSSQCAVSIYIPQNASMSVKYSSEILEVDDVRSLSNTSENVHTNRKASLNADNFSILFNPMTTSPKELETSTPDTTTSYVSSPIDALSSSQTDSGIAFHSQLYIDYNSSLLLQEEEMSSRREVVEKSYEIQNVPSNISTYFVMPFNHFLSTKTDKTDLILEGIDNWPVSMATMACNDEIKMMMTTKTDNYQEKCQEVAISNTDANDQQDEDDFIVQTNVKLTAIQETGLQQTHDSNHEIEHEANTFVNTIRVQSTLSKYHDRYRSEFQDTIESTIIDSPLTFDDVKIEMPSQGPACKEQTIQLEDSIDEELVLKMDTQNMAADSAIENFSISQETLSTNISTKVATVSDTTDISDEGSTLFDEIDYGDYDESISLFQQELERHIVSNQHSIDEIFIANERDPMCINDYLWEIPEEQFDEEVENSRNSVDKSNSVPLNHAEMFTDVIEKKSSLIEFPLVVSAASDAHENESFKDCAQHEQQSNSENLTTSNLISMSSSATQTMDNMNMNRRMSILSDTLKNDQSTVDIDTADEVEVEDKTSIKINEEYSILAYVRNQFVWAASSLIRPFTGAFTTFKPNLEYQEEERSSDESTSDAEFSTDNAIAIEHNEDKKLTMEPKSQANASQERELQSVNEKVDDQNTMNHKLNDNIEANVLPVAKLPESELQALNDNERPCPISDFHVFSSNQNKEIEQITSPKNVNISHSNTLIQKFNCSLHDKSYTAQTPNTNITRPIDSEDEDTSSNSPITETIIIGERIGFNTKASCQLS